MGHARTETALLRKTAFFKPIILTSQSVDSKLIITQFAINRANSNRPRFLLLFTDVEYTVWSKSMIFKNIITENKQLFASKFKVKSINNIIVTTIVFNDII